MQCTQTDSPQNSGMQQRKAVRASKVRAYLAAMEHAGQCCTPHCKERQGLCREIRKGLIHISRCKFRNRFCPVTASKTCNASLTLKRLIQSRCCPKCSQVACLLQLHYRQCSKRRTCFVCNACPQFIDQSGTCCPSSSDEIKRLIMPPPLRRVVTPPPQQQLAKHAGPQLAPEKKQGAEVCNAGLNPRPMLRAPTKAASPQTIRRFSSVLADAKATILQLQQPIVAIASEVGSDAAKCMECDGYCADSSNTQVPKVELDLPAAVSPTCVADIC